MTKKGERVKDNEFRCEMCKGVFKKGWSDEDAEKEAGQIFGKPVSEWNGGGVLLCDDCFEMVHPLKPENLGKLLESRKKV